jgi:hypothetical protein
MKRKPSSAVKISPGSKLGPAGKHRPPKVEKLKGDELPPPEEATRRQRKIAFRSGEAQAGAA